MAQLAGGWGYIEIDGDAAAAKQLQLLPDVRLIESIPSVGKR